MLSTDSWTGGASLTCGTLEFRICALAGATYAVSSAVAGLLVAGYACAVVQRAITGAASPVGVADTHSALAASMT